MEKNLMGTHVVTQVAVVVHDIEKASQEIADILGVEKPGWSWTAGYEKAQTEYLGKPSEAKAKLAFIRIGDTVTLELIEPDMTPSVWRDDLNKNGEGIHHLAFGIKGMKEKIMAFERNGMPLLQKGEYPGGRYAYIDASSIFKTMIELLEND